MKFVIITLIAIAGLWLLQNKPKKKCLFCGDKKCTCKDDRTACGPNCKH